VSNAGKQSRTSELDPAPSHATDPAGTPGKTSAAGAVVVQRKADGGERADPGAVHEAAAAGVQGGGGPLPHLDAIQRSFGEAHDVSGVRAHVGGPAADAAGQIGARAYAMGNDVAFADAPDLHTAAHEAAHVVQQQGGVQLKGGVGAEGDAHEQHADAVADRVVRGDSAADLLAGHGGGGGDATTAVQRDGTARELAADERILSRDPAYMTDGYVGWFRDQAKAKVEAWGLAFDPAAVKLATLKLDGASAKAIVIKWSSAWGTIPITRDFPLTMSPLDARAAVSAAHALPGWSKVGAGDQGKIDNLLGGEENWLSKSSRDHLRPQYKTVQGKTEDEQAAALKATLSTKDTVAGWAPEPMQKAIATVTLSGPTEKKAFDFHGQKADGEEWNAAYSDGVDVKIVAPKAPTTGYHNYSVNEVATAATFMPKPARAVITRIQLNPIVNPDDAHWAVEYNRPDFHSFMTAGAAGVVTIYPDKTTNALPNDDGRRSAMVHETAHTWSYKTWGEDKAKGKWLEWKKAMDDDKVSVSGYATAAIAEDVAETIRVYVSTKGTARFTEYQRIVPKRFEMLKAEYDK
jgi:hypothetical protein